MRIHLVTVANKAPAWVVEGYNEYARRMPPEVRLELIEVKPEPRESGKTPEQMMAVEANNWQVWKTNMHWQKHHLKDKKIFGIKKLALKFNSFKLKLK